MGQQVDRVQRMTNQPSASFIRRQPVAAAAALVTLFTGVVTVLAMFDVWKPDADQMAAITGLITLAVPILATLVWGQVTPVANLDPGVANEDSLADLEAALAKARQEGRASAVLELDGDHPFFTPIAPPLPSPPPAPPVAAADEKPPVWSPVL